MKVDRPGELAAAFTIAEAATHGGAPAYEGGVLVEEYLEGPEFSVDGALHRGHYQPFVVARKRIGFPPYFEETGHIVTAADTLRTAGGTVGIRFANPAVHRECLRRLRFVACQVPRRKPKSWRPSSGILLTSPVVVGADALRWWTNTVSGNLGEADMVTVDDVRAIASTLPRAYEVVVRDRLKWRVGRIVFLALSRDETVMGFGYPKEARAALVEDEPDKFLLPPPSDMRYQWVCARLAALDVDELNELVINSWIMTVPKKVWTEYLEHHAG